MSAFINLSPRTLHDNRPARVVKARPGLSPRAPDFEFTPADIGREVLAILVRVNAGDHILVVPKFPHPHGGKAGIGVIRAHAQLLRRAAGEHQRSEKNKSSLFHGFLRKKSRPTRCLVGDRRLETVELATA